MNSLINSRLAAAGICLLGAGWISLTLLFELHLGLPGTGVEWAKRAVGWAVELWFARTLARGFVRYRNLRVQ